MPPTRFGSIRELPSGRFQARYRPLGGKPITGPYTFDTPEEAELWLEDLKRELEAK